MSCTEVKAQKVNPNRGSYQGEWGGWDGGRATVAGVQGERKGFKTQQSYHRRDMGSRVDKMQTCKSIPFSLPLSLFPFLLVFLAHFHRN